MWMSRGDLASFAYDGNRWDAATYIEPENIDQAAAAIAGRICARSQPCDKSLKNAERFSASEMITRYLSLHQSLLNAWHHDACHRQPN